MYVAQLEFLNFKIYQINFLFIFPAKNLKKYRRSKKNFFVSYINEKQKRVYKKIQKKAIFVKEI